MVQCQGTRRDGQRCGNRVWPGQGTCGRCKGPVSTAAATATSGSADAAVADATAGTALERATGGKAVTGHSVAADSHLAWLRGLGGSSSDAVLLRSRAKATAPSGDWVEAPDERLDSAIAEGREWVNEVLPTWGSQSSDPKGFEMVAQADEILLMGRVSALLFSPSPPITGTETFEIRALASKAGTILPSPEEAVFVSRWAHYLASIESHAECRSEASEAAAMVAATWPQQMRLDKNKMRQAYEAFLLDAAGQIGGMQNGAGSEAAAHEAAASSDEDELCFGNAAWHRIVAEAHRRRIASGEFPNIDTTAIADYLDFRHEEAADLIPIDTPDEIHACKRRADQIVERAFPDKRRGAELAWCGGCGDRVVRILSKGKPRPYCQRCGLFTDSVTGS